MNEIVNLRWTQAQKLVSAGLVSVPDWVPILASDDISIMPIVGAVSGPDGVTLTVGWRSRAPGTNPATRMWPVGVVGHSGDIQPYPGYSKQQCTLVHHLVKELSGKVPQRELEGWPI